MFQYLSALDYDILLRLTMALLLGMLVGTERILAHKTAGMRTYSLVSLGSALFVIISELVIMSHDGTMVNPTLLPASIITGVGFLGTGIMIRHDLTVIGLTTATGLWVSAGIGMAAGFGYFNVAIMGTILAIFIFTVLWFIEQWLKNLPVSHPTPPPPAPPKTKVVSRKIKVKSLKW